MTSTQDLVKLLAEASSEFKTDEFKSIRELLLLIAACVEVDEETGDISLRVKFEEQN